MGPNGMDRAITDAVVDARTDVGTAIAQVITATGNTVVLATIVAVVVLGLASCRRYAEAVLLGVGSASGYVVMVVLKHIVARPRPPVDERLLDIDTYSFPSGHAMMSTIVFGLLAVIAYRVSGWVRAHPVVLVIAPVWAIAIGCTRVYLGVHWATDVIAGWLIGAAWVAGCVWVSAHLRILAPR